jgi:hypothetical protein
MFPAPPDRSADSAGEPELWALHSLGQTARLPRGRGRAKVGPGTKITYDRSRITPAFVCDGALTDGLKRELRRSQCRFAARVPGGTLWLRSVGPTSEISAA